MRLLDVLQSKLIVPRLRTGNKWDAIEELVDRLVDAHEIRILDRREVLEAVLTRERSQSTGLDNQVAVPHCRTQRSDDVLGVLGLSASGIPFESTDGQDARLICLLVFPAAQSPDHLRTLADVVRILSNSEFSTKLFAAAATGSTEVLWQVVESADGVGSSSVGRPWSWPGRDNPPCHPENSDQ